MFFMGVPAFRAAAVAAAAACRLVAVADALVPTRIVEHRAEEARLADELGRAREGSTPSPPLPYHQEATVGIPHRHQGIVAGKQGRRVEDHDPVRVAPT